LDAGLSVAAYGSYYRVGASEAKGMSFESVLDTAATLGAPTIRVWAGEKASADTTPLERGVIVEDALRIAELAEARGLTASFEYHANTLTDTRESVQALMKEITHSGLEFLWQPTYIGTEIESSLERLKDVLPRVRHVHVFYWAAINDWRPLAEGEAAWSRYFEVIRGAGRAMPCLLEFIRDHDPDKFLEDAATLRRWLKL
jgi:sugar phosphate isomerase/epimerase